MKELDYAKLSKQGTDLFEDVRKTLENSRIESLRPYSKEVPNNFVDDNKKINVVFAGQYGAGKSTIINILTGANLEVGEGITTQQCTTLDWKDIHITDTPGIHTQNRPDHDEITYKAIADADLIIFVCTVDGFSGHLGNHFRKLLVEKGKGKEMMLVINKMESLQGETEEKKQVLLEKDILPVISPEYTAEDLYVTFVDAKSYNESLVEEDPEEKEWLYSISGFDAFFDNLNKFIKDKKLLGRCTTSLYKTEQILSEAISGFGSGDVCMDGMITLYTRQRRMLVESKNNLNSKAYSLIRQHTQPVIEWGDDIANSFSSKDKTEDVNHRLQQKYDEVNEVYGEAVDEFEDFAKQEHSRLEETFDDFCNTQFAKTLKLEIERRIGNIKISDKTVGGLKKGSDTVKNFGEYLSKFAQGKKGAQGFESIFKLGTYSGSNAHKFVLDAGKFFGHKFKPWEAVKAAQKIGQVGKILGVAGALVGVAAQIWNDQQEKKVENQLLEVRSDIRNTFNSAANVINMKFDEATQTWVEENYDTVINELDGKIKELTLLADIKEEEYQAYISLLNRTRALIREVHIAAE